MNNTSKETAQEIHNGIHHLAGTAMSAAENLGKELKSSAKQVGCAFKNASTAVASDFNSVAHETYDSLVESSREGAKQLESKVQQSPLLAIGIAFGAGLIASTLLFRAPQRL